MTVRDQAEHESWIATQFWRGSFEKCSAQVTACPWFRLKLESSFLFAYLSHLHPVMGVFLFLRLLTFLDSALFSCWALRPHAPTLNAWRLSCLVCLSTLHRLTIPALADKAGYCSISVMHMTCCGEARVNQPQINICADICFYWKVILASVALICA